jgi:hypothetical protein
MIPFDGKSFGLELSAIVKTYINEITAPLESRIRYLELALEASRTRDVAPLRDEHGGDR